MNSFLEQFDVKGQQTTTSKIPQNNRSSSSYNTYQKFLNNSQQSKPKQTSISLNKSVCQAQSKSKPVGLNIQQRRSSGVQPSAYQAGYQSQSMNKSYNQNSKPTTHQSSVQPSNQSSISQQKQLKKSPSFFKDPASMLKVPS
jgi:hypothetical protein